MSKFQFDSEKQIGTFSGRLSFVPPYKHRTGEPACRQVIVRWVARNIWWEVSEEAYFTSLEAIYPLAWIKDDFLMGEPYDHDENDNEICAAFFIRDGRYYSRHLTVKEFKKLAGKPIDPDRILDGIGCIFTERDLFPDRQQGIASTEILLDTLQEYYGVSAVWWADEETKAIVTLSDLKTRYCLISNLDGITVFPEDDRSQVQHIRDWCTFALDINEITVMAYQIGMTIKGRYDEIDWSLQQFPEVA